MRSLSRLFVALAVIAPSVVVVAAQSADAAGNGLLISNGSVRLSSLVGGQGPEGVRDPEFPEGVEGDEGEGGAPESGRAARVASARVSAAGAEAALTFAGLDHRDNRLANDGNQFSSEPPDQALCVGPRYVLEGVNTVMRVYDKSGAPSGRPSRSTSSSATRPRSTGPPGSSAPS